MRRTKVRGHLRVPAASELQECAAQDNIGLTLDAAEALLPSVTKWLAMLDQVEELPEFSPVLRHLTRDSGHVPRDATEDLFNSFTRICRIEGTPGGPLAGRTVGVKDNLSVAGIPITNGSRMASYVPTVDAVVVERILDAGGIIAGKTNLDDWSSAGYGVTSFFGPPRNPRNPAHSAGGSSGGSGSAVASGAVDMAVGVDQGGSARVPAAFCGCVAVKATQGLVPSFGVTYCDHSMDSVAPITRNVADAATLLEVIAGEDWRDPQWVRGPVEVANYPAAVGDGVAKLKVGLIQEMWESELCEGVVTQSSGIVTRVLKDAGAIVEPVSIPITTFGFAIWVGVMVGAIPAMMRSDGLGFGHLGYVDVGRVHAAGVSRRQEAQLLPPIIKQWLITNSVLQKSYMNTVFAKAHNQRLALRRALDRAFETSDILISPTTPTLAPLLPQKRLSDEDVDVDEPGPIASFTAPFNLSGHPALVMPTGDVDGLPTSIQIVARRFAEYEAFRVAFVLEHSLGN